jgi:hypothetical protein
MQACRRHGKQTTKGKQLAGIINRTFNAELPVLALHDDCCEQARLDAMFRTRKLRAAELDARCYSTLNELPVATAIAVLERFSAKVHLRALLHFPSQTLLADQCMAQLVLHRYASSMCLQDGCLQGGAATKLSPAVPDPAV